MEELCTRIKTVWYDIDTEKRIKLIESMPRRIEAALMAKGMWTNY